ncbi:M20 aminoacylase family protein [Utexia brackfieldae]|uniref:M20 aminoacylase family protein n=1 Tax=Utexia brackfieldae TaxID=3074108 RepID=UPI00370D300B
MINLNIKPEIAALEHEMIEWRHHLHAHPETAFEEFNTTQYLEKKLTEFGVDKIYKHFAPTGLVAIIHGHKPGPWLGLRADIDALDVQEKNSIHHCSTIPGKMHACGHDGHTAMLLGATKYLAQHRDFAGTLALIFQPAEENEGGGRVMVENGLFDELPIESIYGMHNWPNMPFGEFAIKSGPLMAAYDIFEITINGVGAHAAAPHFGHDTIVAAGQLITALQSIMSRNVDPLDAGVVSITQVHSGDTWNVLPQEAILRGTVRTFRPEVQDNIEQRIKAIASGIGSAMNVQIEVMYQRRYPATINSVKETEIAINAARAVVGHDQVNTQPNPQMGSEDFAFMLQQKPGGYIWLGAGKGAGLHNPAFDFNDKLLSYGASYWVEIVKSVLGK